MILGYRVFSDFLFILDIFVFLGGSGGVFWLFRVYLCG